MREMDCGRSFVNKIENDKTNSTFATISKLVKTLSVASDELLKNKYD